VPLLPADKAFLDERGHSYEVAEEAGMTCIVLPDFKLPAGLNRQASTLLVRLQAGYPDLAPDMWWFDPAVRRANGGEIPATQVVEGHLGRQWQRWSRHFQAGQWKSGVDGLESYIALIQRELERSAAA